MRGLRLTRRGEFVRDCLIVIAVAGGFFPAMSLIIAFAHTFGVQ